jgi:hypothetical protein
VLINVAVAGDRNVIKKEAENILKYNRRLVHVECEIKRHSGNNRGDWNHFEIT